MDDCCWEDEETLCEDTECREWIDWLETGNCAKRSTREHSLRETGIAMGVSKERVRVIEERAMGKLKKNEVIIRAAREMGLLKPKGS